MWPSLNGENCRPRIHVIFFFLSILKLPDMADDLHSGVTAAAPIPDDVGDRITDGDCSNDDEGDANNHSGSYEGYSSSGGDATAASHDVGTGGSRQRRRGSLTASSSSDGRPAKRQRVGVLNQKRRVSLYPAV